MQPELEKNAFYTSEKDGLYTIRCPKCGEKILDNVSRKVYFNMMGKALDHVCKTQ